MHFSAVRMQRAPLAPILGHPLPLWVALAASPTVDGDLSQERKSRPTGN